MTEKQTTSTVPASSAFIVRIWHERQKTADRGAVWRGVVIDVATNEQLAFQSFDMMMAFMIEKSGLEPDLSGLLGGD